jgi:hypothetical protein
LVDFVAIGYFFPFWYILPRKIWQPWWQPQDVSHFDKQWNRFLGRDEIKLTGGNEGTKSYKKLKKSYKKLKQLKKAETTVERRMKNSEHLWCYVHMVR